MTVVMFAVVVAVPAVAYSSMSDFLKLAFLAVLLVPLIAVARRIDRGAEQGTTDVELVDGSGARLWIGNVPLVVAQATLLRALGTYAAAGRRRIGIAQGGTVGPGGPADEAGLRAGAVPALPEAVEEQQHQEEPEIPPEAGQLPASGERGGLRGADWDPRYGLQVFGAIPPPEPPSTEEAKGKEEKP